MADDRLLAAMRERGAHLGDVAGRTIARHFGDAPAEYGALRERAGVVALPWLGVLRATGGDRVDFLQGMLSNDVKKLAPGGGCPALLLSEQGRAIADMLVLAEPDALVLLGVAAALAAAQQALERFIVADDVELVPGAPGDVTFAVLGPDAVAVLQRLGVAVPDPSCAHVATTTNGVALTVVRVPLPGAGGVLCRVDGSVAVEWWERALDAGGATPVGHDAFEALRIESGVPWHGRDVTAETLALEAPYDVAVSFQKGCYLGQEVMERVTARGHVNRKLVGLTIAGADAPAAGTHLFAGEREVGWVTSATWSWRLGSVIALGYVRREHLEPGSVVHVGAANGTPATVRTFPL